MPTQYTRADIDFLKKQAGIRAYEKMPRFRKEGREYKALCPFHDDKEPNSFTVYKSRGGEWLFKCHSCGAAGDGLKILGKLKGISFSESVKALADSIGSTPPVPAHSGERPADDRYDDFGYDREASQELLKNTPEAIEYLNKRGVPLDLALRMGVGLMELPDFGSSLVIPYEMREHKVYAKLRALKPKRRELKWKHFIGAGTAKMIFNLAGIDDFSNQGEAVFVTESELDAMMLLALGYVAVSVSSASACVKEDRDTKCLSIDLPEETMEKLRSASRVCLVLDMDAAGEKCARAFLESLKEERTYRIAWEYDVANKKGAKDIGELFTLHGERFKEEFEKLIEQASVPAWRRQFKNPAQMDSAPVRELISGILQEGGVTTITGLSNHGKTLLALSMTKALISGSPFLGHFKVERPCEVLYLCPEVGEKNLRHRLKLFGMIRSDDCLLCRTLSDGQMLKLDDPNVLRAARGRVVFLDTAIRFVEGDENSASDNQRGLAQSCFNLLGKGALSVVAIHHAAKSFGKENYMTLENTHRGSGDFGAFASMSFAVRRLRADNTLLHVETVKERDMKGPEPFQIEGRPWIDHTGDFQMVAKPGLAPSLGVALSENGLAPKHRQKTDKKAQAFELFAQGKSIEETRRAVQIRTKTISDWKKEYEAQAQQQQVANPDSKLFWAAFPNHYR